MLLRLIPIMLLSLTSLTSCGAIVPQPPNSTGGGAGGGSTSGQGGGGGGSGGGVSRQDLVSGSRLKAVIWKGADGSAAPAMTRTGGYQIPLSLFWDTQLQTYCTPGVLVEGAPATGRCLPPPGTNYEVGFFSDAACTHQLMERFVQPAGLPDATVGYVFNVSTRGMSCHRIGAAATGDVFTYGTSCGNYPYTHQPLFEVGAALDLSQFAEFAVAIDQ